MSETTAGASISEEDFAAEFGLDANIAHEPPAPTPEDEASAAAEVAELIDRREEMDDAQDNGELASRRAARTRRSVEDELADLPQNGGDEDDAPPDGEGEGDDEGELGDAPAAPDEVDDERAQAMFDAFMKRFGSRVKLTFRGNGVDRAATLDELRNSIAPGYIGQDGVDRTLREATTQRQAAEQMVQQAQEVMRAAWDDMRAYITSDHDAFVDDQILRHGGIDAARGLHAALTRRLEDYDADPGVFGLRLENRSLADQLRRVVTMLEGGRGATPPGGAQTEEPDPAARETDSFDVPADFGFVPGKGYPNRFLSAATRALDAAANAAGLEFDAVLQTWSEEGRVRPVFEVLRSMVDTRAADAAKLRRGGGGGSAAPAGGGRTGKKPANPPQPKGGRAPRGAGGMPSDREMMEFYSGIAGQGKNQR